MQVLITHLDTRYPQAHPHHKTKGVANLLGFIAINDQGKTQRRLEMSEVVENPDAITVSVPGNANVIRLDTLFEPRERSAFVILNQQITTPIFKRLWQRYTLKVCGDGGANQLYDYFDSDSERERYLPHFIVGDFDSLREDVKRWYQKRGVGILPQTTQWATDMDKCLHCVELYFHCLGKGETLDASEIDPYDGLVQLHKTITDQTPIDVLMSGAIDGRFDHTIHSISVLLKLLKINPDIRLYYLSFTDIIFLVPRGLNYLEYKDSPLFAGSNCGLLPLGGDIVLTTQGFKWDVSEWPSSLKGDVSSSNKLVGIEGVVVQTDNDFIMNIEMNYKDLEI